MSALLHELPPIDQPTSKEPTLAWECAFLGCGALRIWEGGRAGFNLPVCPRCECAIAESKTDRAAMWRGIDQQL